MCCAALGAPGVWTAGSGHPRACEGVHWRYLRRWKPMRGECFSVVEDCVPTRSAVPPRPDSPPQSDHVQPRPSTRFRTLRVRGAVVECGLSEGTGAAPRRLAGQSQCGDGGRSRRHALLQREPRWKAAGHSVAARLHLPERNRPARQPAHHRRVALDVRRSVDAAVGRIGEGARSSQRDARGGRRRKSAIATVQRRRPRVQRRHRLPLRAARSARPHRLRDLRRAHGILVRR